ncbi:Protein TIC 214, partial [Linum grandiflorum]
GWVKTRNSQFQILQRKKKVRNKLKKRTKEKLKKRTKEKKRKVEKPEAWDSIFYGPVIRTVFLLTQSFIRLNILVASLIITKNIIRMLLFEIPEWSEDLADWKREVHVNCSYDGVPVTQEEEEFPQNWETDGIQIKIVFPFRLKFRHRSKKEFPHKNPIKKKVKKANFSFLTVVGLEAEIPFGPPKKFEILEGFYKELVKEVKKKIRKLKKKTFSSFKFF